MDNDEHIKTPGQIAPWLLLSDAVTAHDVETLTQRSSDARAQYGRWRLRYIPCGPQGGRSDRRSTRRRQPLIPPSSRGTGARRSLSSRTLVRTRRATLSCWALRGRRLAAELIAAAALMVNDGVDVVKAVERVKVARGTLLYNKGFQRQLVELAHEEGRHGPHPYAEEEDCASPPAAPASIAAPARASRRPPQQWQ